MAALVTTAATQAQVECPAGEVAIAMNDGRVVVWAGSNLSDYKTFAPHPGYYGCLFQWGYKDAIPSARGPEKWTMPHDEEDVKRRIKWDENGSLILPAWPENEDPCPDDWRMPTADDFQNLTDTKYTTVSWSVERGLKVVPKNGDTDKVLWLPNAGGRFHWNNSMVSPEELGIDRSTAGDAYGAGTDGCYWMSDRGGIGSDDASAFIFNDYFTSGMLPGEGHSSLRGHSVRCVRNL